MTYSDKLDDMCALEKSEITKEQIEKVAMAIAGVRWDKVERPNGNTQGREH